MRDLVRLRSQAMRDLRKTRQQLLSFLLRHGQNSPYRHWTKMFGLIRISGAGIEGRVKGSHQAA